MTTPPDDRPATPAAATAGGRVTRDVGWTLAAQAWPLAVAAVAVPALIGGLGRDRFGLLSIAWLLVGYLSLFDLGLGRALTKAVAERNAEGRGEEVPGLVAAALRLMMLLGLLGAGLGGGLGTWAIAATGAVSPELRGEASRALWVLAASLPFVVGASGLRGVLEAHRRFGAVNLVNVVAGPYTFLGPLAVLPFGGGLVPAVAALLVGRIALWLVYLRLCRPYLPARGGRPPGRVELGSLVRLGGWMTVTNVVGPVLVSVDRFLILGTLGEAAVAYYAAPYEAVTKLWIVPGALVRVLFPAFAAGFAADPGRVGALYGRGVKAATFAMVPIALVVSAFAGEGLTLWLGADFARRGAGVLRWLAVGVAFNGIAQVPFALIQSRGRADLTARLHLVELVAYLPAAWFLIGRRGVEGAAIAWMLRNAADAAALLWLAGRGLPSAPRHLAPAALGACGLAMLPALLPTMATGSKAAAVAVALAAFAVAGWSLALSPSDRSAALGLLGRRRLPAGGEMPT